MIDKGVEVTSKLQNVDCDPKLKEIIIKQQYDIYFLNKQLLEAHSAINYMADIVNKVAEGTGNIITKLKSLEKAQTNDND
jgi:hypothetical protein